MRQTIRTLFYDELSRIVDTINTVNVIIDAANKHKSIEAIDKTGLYIPRDIEHPLFTVIIRDYGIRKIRNGLRMYYGSDSEHDVIYPLNKDVCSEIASIITTKLPYVMAALISRRCGTLTFMDTTGVLEPFFSLQITAYGKTILRSM